MGFELQIDEEKASLLKIGQRVEVTIKASNEKIDGRVCYISYIPHNELITVKVKLQSNDKVKIGYNVKAKILLDEPIDENTVEFDVKNSITKIGKTVVTYKNDNKTQEFSTPQEIFSDEDLLEMFAKIMEEKGIEEYSIEDMYEETPGVYNISDLYEVRDLSDDPDVEAISDYFNGYWSEYWSEYWEAYYRNN